jgi:hypothetical protein
MVTMLRLQVRSAHMLCAVSSSGIAADGWWVWQHACVACCLTDQCLWILRGCSSSTRACAVGFLSGGNRDRRCSLLMLKGTAGLMGQLLS